MKFETTIGDDELQTFAWLLKTKTKTSNVEFYKGCVLTAAVLATTIYNVFFYEESTSAQKCILLILSAVCIIKTVFCKAGKMNYLALAKHKSKKLKNKNLIYDFKDEAVSINNGKEIKILEYKDLKEWGENKKCIYLLFQSGETIIINEQKYAAEIIRELKEKLQRIGF